VFVYSHGIKWLRDFSCFLVCFMSIGCATAEDIKNRYKKLHVENLLSAEQVFVAGFNDLIHLPIPTQFRGNNPSYMKCDENRWNLLHQAPPEIRRACAKVLNSDALIKVVKGLINTPYQFRNGAQVYPAKKYSNKHEMEVEVIVDSHSRDFTEIPFLFKLSTNVATTVILRSISDGYEVKGSGSKAINDVNLGNRLSSEAYSGVAYLLALNGALLESLGNAYSKLPKHINHFLIAGKGREAADGSSNAPETARARDNDNEVPDKKINPQASSGSGFFISKLGHVITNAHVVKNCKTVSVGDNSNHQARAEIISTDKNNDLALLKLLSMDKTSDASKSLIRKLAIKIVPLAANGLLRSNDVKLGEKVLVAGYPYGEVFSDTIKVTSGIVSATRGAGDNSAQFQLDAAVQSGNSGGPIYDSGGNIVGVVVSQLNKLKVAKAIGTLPENVNFGIKASTVRTFLNSSGLPSKTAKRTVDKSTVELAEIAQRQALMVLCAQ